MNRESSILKLVLLLLLESCTLKVLSQPYQVSMQESPNNSSILANFVCDAVHDVMRNETGMKRVAIIKHATSFNRDFIDEIGKCLASDFSVLIMDSATGFSNISMQKPSMIVILTEQLRVVSRTFCSILKVSN